MSASSERWRRAISVMASASGRLARAGERSARSNTGRSSRSLEPYDSCPIVSWAALWSLDGLAWRSRTSASSLAAISARRWSSPDSACSKFSARPSFERRSMRDSSLANALRIGLTLLSGCCAILLSMRPRRSTTTSRSSDPRDRDLALVSIISAIFSRAFAVFRSVCPTRCSIAATAPSTTSGSRRCLPFSINSAILARARAVWRSLFATRLVTSAAALSAISLGSTMWSARSRDAADSSSGSLRKRRESGRPLDRASRRDTASNGSSSRASTSSP